jgi:beta-phosphoglucomutase-like phosphatase (HAD superfamily)
MISIPPGTRGLIFDCDGTIADTMPLHYQSWVAVLREHGAEFPEALFYEMAGITTPRIIELLNERHGWSIPVAQAAQQKERLFEQLIPKVMPIEPVVQLVLEYAGRLPMAVATGGTRAICSKTLAPMMWRTASPRPTFFSKPPAALACRHNNAARLKMRIWVCSPRGPRTCL